MDGHLVVPLASAERRRFGRATVLGGHRLGLEPMFGDAALVDLLDRFPRERLLALHMGEDPARRGENRLALHAGLTGTELLRAVRRGRLWLNLTRVELADTRLRRLVDGLYGNLAAELPGFAPGHLQANLLISSPRAQVYYHVDGPASVLWHLRGRQRLWVYPADDARFVGREALEDIFAGVGHEDLPYEPAFDAAAEVHDLVPGQWVAWPQNAPHRIGNLEGLNVSLSTEHFTAAGRRRARMHVANRFFRLHGWPGLEAREDGAAAWAKVLVQRAAHALGLDPRPPKHHDATLRVAPDAPGGVMPLGLGSRGHA